MRRTRTSNTTLASDSLPQHMGFAGASHDSWRALFESQLVRRIVRGARLWDSGRLGELDTRSALEHGRVGEVVETRRFLENHPVEARRINDLATATGARVTMIAGIAAFELDLLAEGVGAVLREAPWKGSAMLA